MRFRSDAKLDASQVDDRRGPPIMTPTARPSARPPSVLTIAGDVQKRMNTGLRRWSPGILGGRSDVPSPVSPPTKSVLVPRVIPNPETGGGTSTALFGIWHGTTPTGQIAANSGLTIDVWDKLMGDNVVLQDEADGSTYLDDPGYISIDDPDGGVWQVSGMVNFGATVGTGSLYFGATGSQPGLPSSPPTWPQVGAEHLPVAVGSLFASPANTFTSDPDYFDIGGPAVVHVSVANRDVVEAVDVDVWVWITRLGPLPS